MCASRQLSGLKAFFAEVVTGSARYERKETEAGAIRRTTPVPAQGSRASRLGNSGCQRERPDGAAPVTGEKAQSSLSSIVTTATRLTPLSAMTRPLPSLVGIILRTTPPPDGIEKVWNFWVFGSKRTRAFGLVLPSTYHTMSCSVVMP